VTSAGSGAGDGLLDAGIEEGPESIEVDSAGRAGGFRTAELLVAIVWLRVTAASSRRTSPHACRTTGSQARVPGSPGGPM